MLTNELDGVRERKWNMEKVLCFMSVTLQTSPDIKRAIHIRRRIKQRLDEWDKEKYQMLVSNTVMCAEAQMGRKKGAINVKDRANVCLSLSCRGKIPNYN